MDWLAADELEPAWSSWLGPFYEAAQEGTLRLPECGRCHAPRELEQYTCAECSETTAHWRAVPLRGIVHALTRVHRFEPRLVRAASPYVVADVEFETGHRLVMTTTHAHVDDLRINTHVTIGFRRIGSRTVPAILATTSLEET